MHVCDVVSMQRPGSSLVHASGALVPAVVGASVGRTLFVPVGQHLTLAAPVHSPTLTTAPSHVCVLVSMHRPGALLRHPPAVGVGVGGGVGGGAVGLGASRLLGQHLTCRM